MSHFNTRAIHAGQEPEEQFGAVIPPIYMTSTFAQEAPGKMKGYDYTRAGNPNFTNLETAFAAVENGKFATYLASGLSCVTALLRILKPGDRVLGINDLYGGTYRALSKVFEPVGINFDTDAMTDLGKLDALLSSGKYQMISFESPTNPLLKLVDVKAVCDLARKHKVISFVDNTFATPYLQNPLDLGADIVWHSTTKYIGGHSDVIGGALITNSEEYHTHFQFARLAMGLNSSPFDAWLTHRGLKTLGVRMKQHCINAQAVAEMLEAHPLVEKVYYPGLASHPQHELAKKQMNGFGGIVSVEFKLNVEQTAKLISQFKLFTLAESLGGIESLVDHPASMTHASIPSEERHKAGLQDGLVRLSVGIEGTQDLLDDLSTVLDNFK
jgi:cystathionine beta-lyase/cystathionine gamma-synthase